MRIFFWISMFFFTFTKNKFFLCFTVYCVIYISTVLSTRCTFTTNDFSKIWRVIGIIFMLGIVKLPTCRICWQPATRVNLIAKILRVMHFNDNSQIPTDSRIQQLLKTPVNNWCFEKLIQINCPRRNVHISQWAD